MRTQLNNKKEFYQVSSKKGLKTSMHKNSNSQERQYLQYDSSVASEFENASGAYQVQKVGMRGLPTMSHQLSNKFVRDYPRH